MKNTAGVIGGKPIGILLQSISGKSAFYDIHEGKREVLCFLFGLGDHTRLINIISKKFIKTRGE
jgi:hypothetical protein